MERSRPASARAPSPSEGRHSYAPPEGARRSTAAKFTGPGRYNEMFSEEAPVSPDRLSDEARNRAQEKWWKKSMKELKASSFAFAGAKLLVATAAYGTVGAANVMFGMDTHTPAITMIGSISLVTGLYVGMVISSAGREWKNAKAKKKLGLDDAE